MSKIIKKNNYKYGLVKHPSGKFRIVAHAGKKIFYINGNKKYFRTPEDARLFLEKYINKKISIGNFNERGFL